MNQAVSAPIPRMRTVAGIVDEIKVLDPGSGVTKNCVRQMVKNGEISAVWAGNKALINLDDVLELLMTGTGPKAAEESGAETVGGIRKIDANLR